MIKRICALLFVALALGAWKTHEILDVAFGTVPASCTLITNTVDPDVRELFIQNSLNNDITISTASDCSGTNNAFRILAGTSLVWTVPPQSQSSDISLYYMYEVAPTSGRLVINYIFED